MFKIKNIFGRKKVEATEVFEETVGPEEQDMQDLSEIRIYADTNEMMPGLTVYQLIEVPTTNKKPYVTFRPEPHIIVQMYNTGVNGGTTFISYSPVIEKGTGFTNINRPAITIKAQLNSFYSPLTLGHAAYICKKLNKQMRYTFETAVHKR